MESALEVVSIAARMSVLGEGCIRNEGVEGRQGGDARHLSNELFLGHAVLLRCGQVRAHYESVQKASAIAFCDTLAKGGSTDARCS